MKLTAEHIRWRVAYALNRLPWTCWADLVSWAMQDKHTNRLVRRPLRECGSTRCRDEASTHRDKSCYCGKFQRDGGQVTVDA